MSALANRGWESTSRAMEAAMPYPERSEVVDMRERLRAVRDTLLVLMLQIVFRVVLMMRRWNY
jgi:hypothetical protein